MVNSIHTVSASYIWFVDSQSMVDEGESGGNPSSLDMA